MREGRLISINRSNSYAGCNGTRLRRVNSLNSHTKLTINRASQASTLSVPPRLQTLFASRRRLLKNNHP